MRGTPAPVAILHQGAHLVVSIRAALDDTQMVRLCRELGGALDDRKVRGVLIDVAALDVLDSFGSRNLCELVAVARLRGARAVIVGVEPTLALSMVHLGIDTAVLRAALDVTDGLEVVADAGSRAAVGGRPVRARIV